MKFLDEFRDPEASRKLVAQLRRTATRRWSIMEVCGGQTHSLLRHGIEAELADVVELIHGPGCPVCVTSARDIDFAQLLARRPGVTVASFGDMLRVPGSRTSLLGIRAEGGDVRPVYSPLDAVQLARREPARQVVFFAVGFETTAPATALAVLQADQLQLDNFSLLVAHVRVQPAMELLVQQLDCRIDGFLAAGHVCTVLGCDSYESFVERYRRPVVVTGFEPTDLLDGLHECVRQLESGEARVANRYERSVRAAGNTAARQAIDEVYEPCDRDWRGIGTVPGGGLRLRARFERFDAARRFALDDVGGQRAGDIGGATLPLDRDCRAGDVLAGRLKPTDCPHFGAACTPDTPLGAPMVSSEGACAAYFLYGGHLRSHLAPRL